MKSQIITDPASLNLPVECPPTSKPSLGETATGAVVKALGSLPCVDTVLHGISTFNIDAVTRLLEKAAYLSLLMSARPASGDPASGEARFAGEARRFTIATEQGTEGQLDSRNVVGQPGARLEFAWRLIADDHEGHPDVRPEPIALDTRTPQRFEVSELVLRFEDEARSGLRAYGTGSTLPASGSRAAAVGIGAVAGVLEGWGQLAGLAGSIVLTGDLRPSGELVFNLIARVMDPDGGLLTQASLARLAPQPNPEPGVTYLSFLGQVDPEHPVTLRLSLTEGILGSNVFEDLRVAQIDWDVAEGRIRSRTTTGSIAGTVEARLDFDPLSLAPITPVQTHDGVFSFHDAQGRCQGSFFADMLDGRSFRTSVEGMLLPVFRFCGFGPVCGGTGEFSGVGGIMTLNAVISVQPRTLSNLYTIRLNDPHGRYRALLEGTGQ